MTRDLGRGLANQLRVVQALVLRETRTRFGKHTSGYLWAFVEPMAWIVTFAAMFHISGRHAPHGMDPVGFLATGIFVFLVFRTTTNRAMVAVESNKGLLFYPHVRPLDLIIARSVLEAATLTAVMAVVLAINCLLQERILVDNLLELLVAVALAAALGTSLGLILCAATVFSNAVQRIQGPLMRPLFWISGLFFSLNEIPAGARDLLLYNPIVHLVESARDGWYPQYHAHYVNLYYPAAFVLVFSLIGLPLERVARRRLEVG